MALNKKEILLLKEYELLMQHYQHEDRLVEQRNYLFIFINLALLATLRFLTPTEPLQSMNQVDIAQYLATNWWLWVICIIGVVISILWLSVSLAGKYWISLRMNQAALIEKELGYLTTFQAEDKLCAERETITLWNKRLQPIRRLYLPATKVSIAASAFFTLLWLVMLTLICMVSLLSTC